MERRIVQVSLDIEMDLGEDPDDILKMLDHACKLNGTDAVGYGVVGDVTASYIENCGFSEDKYFVDSSYKTY